MCTTCMDNACNVHQPHRFSSANSSIVTARVCICIHMYASLCVRFNDDNIILIKPYNCVHKTFVFTCHGQFTGISPPKVTVHMMLLTQAKPDEDS